MHHGIKNVTENGLKVILVTNFKYGGVYAEYGSIGYNQSLRDLGVIMASDLNPFQEILITTLVFGNENLPSKEIEKYFLL